MSNAKATNAGSKLFLIESRRFRLKSTKRARRSAAADKIARKLEGGFITMKCIGLTSDGLTVATVTVATTGAMPSEGVTEEGEIVQVDIAGAPLQASDTAPLNPPEGVTVRLNATVSP